jgi:predicted N-acyltransferase
VREAGVSIKRLTGSDISESDWDFFYACYCNTYHLHGASPYLTRRFFRQLGEQMADNVLLVIATLAGQPVAAALNLFGTGSAGISQLYGRYWGALAQISGLHFELCYYQAQEFCIERGIRYFEGGAQGEHKLARGFTPRPTCSFHKIADSRFANAIEHFVRREATGIEHYQHELEERSPFRRQSGDGQSAR